MCLASSDVHGGKQQPCEVFHLYEVHDGMRFLPAVGLVPCETVHETERGLLGSRRSPTRQDIEAEHEASWIAFHRSKAVP